ncbi:MAG: hypothetical protein Q8R24_09405 [Legionellaceae bacterium]|nr:hypothetical protein [Legionellaceae bacterium]
MISVLKFIDSAWGYLSAHDQKELIAHDMKYISRYISSFPLDNAKIFYEKIKNGSLMIRKNLSNVYMNGDRFRAEFYEREAVEDELFDYVVNATSVDKYITMSPGLYLNLVESNIIIRNQFGGVLIDKRCRILDPSGKIRPMFAAGPITKGRFLITNLLSTSAKQALMIAKEIVDD